MVVSIKNFTLYMLFMSLAASVLADVRPRLILQITVDQLRGDLPQRFSQRLGKGGLRFLMDEGTYYTNAHYQHANTETIVGHTTLATGAFPAVHGMVANVWLDQEKGKLTYNIEDPHYHMLGKNAAVDKLTEIDPTQKTAKSDGRSPKAILTSTFSDELFIATAGQAKIFAVSVKDRGAVSMAGHAGKAFWFSKQSGEFVTSNYYYQQYPQWVTQWNAQSLADRYKNTQWKLLKQPSSYLFEDDRPYETDIAGFRRTFPHPYGHSEKYYYTLLTTSPAGDELTLEFAQTLIDKEQLGQDTVPDYLAVSFSSTDYVGHLFGPSSVEEEDNILRLDKTLAKLFATIDDKVGLENTLIVLSADHGAAEAPDYMASIGMQTGRLSKKSIDTAPVIQALEKRFGFGKELIQLYYHPYVYLNHKVIRDKGLNLAAVEHAVAHELLKIKGIAAAVSSSDLQKGRLPDSPLMRQIRRNFKRQRSGDIYLVQEPYWFLYSDESLPLAAMHGSPWAYDTYVPIIFAGMKIPAQRVSRKVHPLDIAMTLANFLHIKPPSGATGNVLPEIAAVE